MHCIKIKCFKEKYFKQEEVEEQLRSSSSPALFLPIGLRHTIVSWRQRLAVLTMSPTTSAEHESMRFWCHECGAAVATRIDESTEEVCCVQCGGNFVEEVEEDDPPQDFHMEQVEDTQTQTNSSTTSAENTTRAEIRTEFGGTRPLPRPRGRAARFEAGNEGADGSPQLPDFFQLLSGATGRSTRFMSSTGNPVEFYVSGSGEGGDPMGLLDALGGMFPMLAGNPGDYAFGNMTNVINQLMQNDPNRHGAPPAAKEVVEKLPKVKITQAEVDGSAECPVCKDFFAVDEEVHRLPCEHSFHPDCILPWLKQHNSCPLCRFELPTDDPDYERRRAAASST